MGSSYVLRLVSVVIGLLRTYESTDTLNGSISVHLFPMSVDSQEKHHAEGFVEGGSQARGDVDCAPIGASSVDKFRDILQIPLQKLVGEGIDAKPRGFENALKFFRNL